MGNVDPAGGVRGRFRRRLTLAIALLSALAALAAAPVIAQESWARLYHQTLPDGRPGALLGGAIAADRSSGGGFYATAYIDNATLAVLRLSPAGDIVWSGRLAADGRYTTSSDMNGSEVAALAEGGCAVGWGPFLVRLNADGKAAWCKRYTFRRPGDRNDLGFTFLSVRQIPSGGYIVSGRKGGDYGALFLSRLDRSGNPQWQKWLEAAPSDGPGAWPMPDGSFALGGTSLGEGSADVHLGAKILRIDGDGKARSTYVYHHDLALAKPPSSYGQIVAAAPTPDGGLVAAVLRFETGFGTLVFKIDASGGVAWTKWIAGRIGGGETWVHSAATLPDGSLVFAGHTTEFTDHTTATRKYALLLKMSASGEILWMKTAGGYTSAADYAVSVAGTADGGLIAAGTAGSLAKPLALLLIRTTADGSVARLGDILTPVDLARANGRNPRLRLTTPPVTRIPAGRGKPTDAAGEALDGGVTTSDGGIAGELLSGLANENVILEPLYPDRPEEPSVLMKGGVAYRYFLLKTASGNPVPGAEVRYKTVFIDQMCTATSSSKGEVVFEIHVPSRFDPKLYNNVVDVDRILTENHRAPLASQPVFALDLRPLTYSTNWTAGMGASGKVGLGVLVAGAFGQIQQTGGMVLSRTTHDPDKDGGESLAVTDLMQNESGLGLEGGFDFKGHIGPVKAKGLDAEVSAMTGPYSEFTTLFTAPSAASTSERLMAGLAFLTGIQNALGGGSTQLVSMAVDAIMASLSSKVDVRELVQGLSLTVAGDLSGIKLGVETKAGELSGLGLVNAGESYGAKAAVVFSPLREEIGGKITLVFEQSFGLVEALGFDFGKVEQAQEVTVEIAFGRQAPFFRRLNLLFSRPPDARGEVQSFSVSFTPELLGDAARSIEYLASFAAFQAEASNGRFTLDKTLAAEILRAVLHAASMIQVPYERMVEMDEKPTTLDLSLGVDVGGWQVDFGAKPTFGRYESYPVERGVFVVIDETLKVARVVPLAVYGPTIYDRHVDTLPSMAGDILKAVGNLLVQVWNIVGGSLSDMVSTVLDVSASIGGQVMGSAQVVFEAGTGLFSEFAAPEPFPEFVAQAARGGPNMLVEADYDQARTKRHPTKPARPTRPQKKGGADVWIIAYAPRHDANIVGGYYGVEPIGRRLSKPARLTVSYTEAAAKDRDEASFELCRYDGEKRAWTAVAAERDPARRTFTAEVETLGEYAVRAKSETVEQKPGAEQQRPELGQKPEERPGTGGGNQRPNGGGAKPGGGEAAGKPAHRARWLPILAVAALILAAILAAVLLRRRRS